ncbi:MAG: beta-ketoacyl-ACP synthase III [Gemmatimonadaceae bacterium]
MKRPVAYFAGIGAHAPRRVIRNNEFAKMGLDTNDEWIVQRTGIRERHIAGPNETNCSMSAIAARTAMERAGVHAGELDIIVLGTASPDRLLPATAVDLQAELGATRAAAFDVAAACSSWLYGLIIAESLMMSGTAETALVVGTEKLSAITDWTDRSTAVLFGDGSGAAVLKRSKHHKGILSTYFRSDGTLAQLLYRPGGGATYPFDEKVLSDRSQYIKMEGREVFKHAVRSMSEAADRALDGAKLTGAEIDLLIPHQANVRIIEATAKHANVPMDKVFVNVDRYGNTSSASIPIALDEALAGGHIGDGATVLMVAFGAGFTWASMVVRF